MMRTRKPNPRAGFTIIEMVVAVAIMMVIMGVVLQQIQLVIQRSTGEQIKLDLFQEGREFMDQMGRDLHQGGYPNPRNLGPNLLGGTAPNSQYGGVGLVQISPGELWFEGDVDGTGKPSVVRYYFDNSSTAGQDCPCLKREQLTPKADATAPLSQLSSSTFFTEVQNVQNDPTQSTGAIFRFFRADGTEFTGATMTSPATFTANAVDLAKINSIRVMLIVQSKYPDPQTRVKPVTTLLSTIMLNNCSEAASSYTMSCQ
jgi:type II secretory pathway pseudopilin PulG